MVDISGGLAKIKSWVLNQIAAIVLTALADVDKTNIGNDKVLVYKSASGKHEYETQSGGGVSDHGALTGLADDDHPQYTRDAEVDAIIATHTTIASAHHSKYTNTEAVAAVVAADKFLKNDADDETTGKLWVKSNLKTGIEATDPRSPRPLNLINNFATMRVWRYTGTLGQDPALEFIWGNNGDAGGNNGNYWWDIYVLSRDGGMYFRDRSFGQGSAQRLQMTRGGDVGIGCTFASPATVKLEINGDSMCIRTAKTPASAGASGKQGQMCWDASYLYTCTATNTWKRTAIATW